MYLHTCVLVYVKDKLSYHRYNSCAILVVSSPLNQQFSWLMLNPLIINLKELESDTDEHLQEKWGGIDLPLKLQVESQQNLSTFLEPTCPLNANTTGAAFPRNKENERN